MTGFVLKRSRLATGRQASSVFPESESVARGMRFLHLFVSKKRTIGSHELDWSQTVAIVATTLVLLCFAPDPVGASNIPKAPHQVSSFTAAPEAHYPFRENMYEPLALPDGRVAALSVARNNGQQTMQARYSSDEGHTWSGPENLFDWPKSAGGFGLFERLLDHDGEIHVFILCDANTGILYPTVQEGAHDPRGFVLDIWHARSFDHRTRWGRPHRIWMGPASDLLSVIEMRNGRIVLPFSFKRHQSSNDPRPGFEGYTYFGQYSVTSVYSDDGGETWHNSPDVLSVQTPDLSTYGADEPAIIQLRDGRVWMLLRTERGRFYQSFSSDGEHWLPPTPSKLISSDSPAGLLRLKDGSLLLFSNACLRYPYAYGARYVLHGAISQDEGHTWRGFRELLRDPYRNEPINFHADYGWSYSFPTLTEKGNVLFTNWVQTGRVRSFTLFDPSWLYETSQETDFSKEIDEWTVFGSKGVDLQSAPDGMTGRVLAIHKADPDWPAAAVWNFPVGAKGTLRLSLMLKAGFQGAQLGLTDHYSVPWDDEDRFFNVFNLPITAEGTILPGVTIDLGQWHDVVLSWDVDARKCMITLDGRYAGTLQDNRRSAGINYLRLRSTADKPDGGLLLRRVAADVSASWVK